MDTRHLEELLPGSEQLCDLILVADKTHFPVHSAYLASHCEFIRHFSLDVGPFSWKAPQIIEEPFQDHSCATMHCLLLGVYGNDDMDFTDFDVMEPWQAWDLYNLADQLHCPKVLDICVEYLNDSCSFFTKSAQVALRCCIVTEHIPRLSQLRQACTAAIAADFQAVGNDERMVQLSREALLHIMQAMATQIVKLKITSDAETASCKPKAGPSLIVTDSSSESDSEDESEEECNRQRELLRKRKAGPSVIITDSSSESDSEDESECDRQRQLLRMRG
ncbi:hypothetical protein ABBQ32_010845 [Trebouxia sp. C0010 RCD-2024]